MGLGVKVDVCGECMILPRVTVQSHPLLVDFLADERLKEDGKFQLGVFFSKAVLSGQVFWRVRNKRMS